ncbi:hypothetical protein EPN28_03715 [Patescibacteria group bacterium]|nr:MAG: hypothetical protein EPN28_03715 [Patescibacteria group bacterium]
MPRHIVSFVIVLFLAPLIIATVGALTLSKNLLAPQFYKTTLKKADAYNQALRLAPGIIYSQLIKENKAAVSLSEADIAGALADIFSAQWLETNSDKAIDQVVGYLNGTEPSIDFTVSVKDQKAAAAKNLSALVRKNYNALPVCSPMEIIDFQLRAQRGENPAVTCRNPAMSEEKAMRDFDAELKIFLKQIPDTVDVGEALAPKQSELALARAYAARAKQGAGVAAVVALALLAVIALIHKKNKKALLAWLAAPLAASSLWFFANAAQIKTRLLDAVHLSPTPEAARAFIMNLLQTGLDELFRGVKNASVVLFIAALVLFVLAWKSRKENAPAGL